MRHLWPRSGLWRHRDFLHLWGAQSISAVGSRITRTVLPLYAILSIDATPNQVAMLAALSTAPGFVVGLSLGGTVDRQQKRGLLIGADLVRAAVLLVVPAVAWFGSVTMGQLYAVAALAGAATALFQIADNSYLPALVRRDQLIDGNAKLHASDSFAEVTGPGLGGILMQLLGAPGAIVLDAASYLTSAGLLARIRTVERPPPPGTARPNR